GTEKSLQSPEGNEVARIRYFKSNPVPQFHGEVDLPSLKKNISNGLYPNLQKAIHTGEVSLETVATALKERGFRNLVEIELFLKDPADPRGPQEKLENVGRTSAPT